MLSLTGKDTLIRNQPVDHRIKYYQDKKNLLITEGKHTLHHVIIVMEYVSHLASRNICLAGDRKWKSCQLLEYARRRCNRSDSYFLVIPKCQKMVQLDWTVG